ncbi:class I SAM-dependent methyltransferase [Frisingicoccus caecimuris]|uniref:Putative rRNA methylase n=1 Tax=Frisingicoccus caecimuris TaxID=1796636 RepID=A0A4R2LDC8_9FIRM|nr:class I SAM-dependent methyltransferase [Frisingicoccus caecimuris]MCR1917989.1 class I SAM-dependent methyltransferase [Frisingicoccus caecimuris]TCO86459.1 putative rRNA methylase [Frisingicoccus caecimuris]
MQMVDRVHQLLSEKLKPGDRAADATMGNGWDTLKLCELVGERGMVYGFDIQEKAVSTTKERLENAGFLGRAKLFCCSHSEAGERIHENIQAFTMNLGYLPGGDKKIITRSESTVAALRALTQLLSPGGLGLVLIYYGHPGGNEEKEAVETFMKEMPSEWGEILRTEIVNRKNCPPILYIMEKK